MERRTAANGRLVFRTAARAGPNGERTPDPGRPAVGPTMLRTGRAVREKPSGGTVWAGRHVRLPSNNKTRQTGRSSRNHVARSANFADN